MRYEEESPLGKVPWPSASADLKRTGSQLYVSRRVRDLPVFSQFSLPWGRILALEASCGCLLAGRTGLRSRRVARRGLEKQGRDVCVCVCYLALGAPAVSSALPIWLSGQAGRTIHRVAARAQRKGCEHEGRVSSALAQKAVQVLCASSLHKWSWAHRHALLCVLCAAAGSSVVSVLTRSGASGVFSVAVASRVCVCVCVCVCVPPHAHILYSSMSLSSWGTTASLRALCLR